VREDRVEMGAHTCGARRWRIREVTGARKAYMSNFCDV
jgi:hypothetical protein